MAIRDSNEIEGNARKAVGNVKEKLGQAIGNRDLEEQGAAEKTAGGFRAAVGKATRKVNEVIDDAADDLKKP